MKQILFFILLFAWAGSKVTINAEETNTHKEIILTVVQDGNEREIKGEQSETTSGDVPISRSIIHQPVYAYIYNGIVAVAFEEILSTVTVIIINETTGETVYSEVHSSPAALNIDLNGESTGNYLIEIETDDTYLQGIFSL
ncbi:DUF3244 domain-containing protein [uncultured Bacteroides sp.]|uniref:DUF3244 domain-containing protein n=1 Tax=uncultured Bacteroides sp. TaxID=162156 RepID=UPI002596E5E6|nr:DUF3244 domain-containing protein [uncultured Bacteroides sp.]